MTVRRMNRFISLVAVALWLAACASTSSRQATPESAVGAVSEWPVILRVEVLSVEGTDWHPECVEEGCIPFHFWFKYRARVKDVIDGSWRETEVEFTHLQHGQYIRAVTKDCYVVLRPAGTDLREKIRVPYVADRLLSRFWKSDRAEIKAFSNGT